MWQSSPMAMPWASSAKPSIGPSARRAAAKPGGDALGQRALAADRLGRADPEPERLARPVVEGAVADAAARPRRARPRRPSRARSPRVIAPAASREWAGASRTPPLGDQARRPPPGSAGPALQHDRAADGVALGRAHQLPLHRRPGVQDGAALQARDQLARGAGARRSSGAPPAGARARGRWPRRRGRRRRSSRGRRRPPGRPPRAAASRARSRRRPGRAARRPSGPGPR